MTHSNAHVFERVRVLIVEDHLLYREVVRMVLSRSNDIDIVGEATNGMEAVEKAAQLLPDVVVMDISMPRMDGVIATESIKARFPHTVVIGLSAHESDHREAMYAAGACVVLMKEDVVDELYPALRRAMAEKVKMVGATSAQL